MRKTITFLVFALITLSTHAQSKKYEHDLILTSDREQIWCDISEVSDNEVKCRPVDMPEGVIVTRRVDLITYIVFRNGVKKDFNTTQTANAKPTIPHTGYQSQKTYNARPGTASQQEESLPYIIKSGRKYYADGRLIDKLEVKNLLLQDPFSYNAFAAASITKKTGWTFFGLGLTLDAISAICFLVNGEISGAMLGVSYVGGLMEIACIPILCVGYSRSNRAIQNYNTFVRYKKHSSLELKVNAQPNGIGLALQF